MTKNSRASFDDLPKPETASGLATAGGIASAVWLAGILLFVALRWDKMVSMEPNALGDFLAGVFAPLAFLWLVLGFTQQGVELRNNGKALLLQGEELKNSVAEQRALVEVTTRQLELEYERLVSERAHLAADQERQRVLAEPSLELTTSYTVSSGDTITTRGFSLANHGAACTRVVISGPGGKQLAHKDRLEAGDRIGFDIQANKLVQSLVFEVRYLNQNRVPQIVNFVATQSGDGLQIDQLPR